MMEKILTFITPGPMTETFGFSTRVFTSWVSLGLVWGLILGIINLSQVTSDPATVFFTALLAGPIAMCLFGLIGVGINSLRGVNTEHPGWYWYLFPIVNYLIIIFWLAFAIIAFILAFAGVTLPQPSSNYSSSRRRVNPKQAKEQIRREIKQKQSKEFLNEYENILRQHQQAEMERLKQERLEEQERKNLVESLSIRDRILLKIQGNPGVLLEDILTEDEMEELALMILEALL